jgi:hypothetical protein
MYKGMGGVFVVCNEKENEQYCTPAAANFINNNKQISR